MRKLALAFVVLSSLVLALTGVLLVCFPEENAVVWYSLLPGPGYELFSINPYTGLITTASTLDREQQQRFTLRGRKTQKTAESEC